MRRLIDADVVKDICPCGYCESYAECRKEIEDAPTIQTKEVKYFDEEEKVWKIGSVIVE